MNPEVKAQWVAALRSGEYVQGRERLRTVDDTFCCLGVLCDLHARARGYEWGSVCDRHSYLGADMVPPEQVLDWAGLRKNTATVELPFELRSTNTVPRMATLTYLNDMARCNFNEIADIVEYFL